MEKRWQGGDVIDRDAGFLMTRLPAAVACADAAKTIDGRPVKALGNRVRSHPRTGKKSMVFHANIIAHFVQASPDRVAVLAMV